MTSKRFQAMKSPFQQITAALLLAVMFGQTTGCVSAATRPTERPRPAPVARILLGLYQTNGREASVTLVAIDGYPESRGAAVVPPGCHTVGVITTWSNGWREHHELTVEVAAERDHVVLAYELATGQEPATAELRQVDKPTAGEPPAPAEPPSLAQEAGAAVAGTVIEAFVPYILLPAVFLAPFAALILLAHKHLDEPPEGGPTPSAESESAPPPDGRPFEGCCFVWIEDRETGELVAGTRPSGPARRMTPR